ncbi:MAG: hypothetical protein AB7E51_02405 [Pseudodesulfovibrio sp.]|uniref:hypothetical protein n=1 Tax=Pseudodesulfovibrio sp. TaxID=2035812 RepID=UPI003D11D2B4
MKLFLENLDGLDEKNAAYYDQKDTGGYELNLDRYTSNLKSALNAARGERDEIKAKFKGIDPEKFQSLVTENKDLQTKIAAGVADESEAVRSLQTQIETLAAEKAEIESRSEMLQKGWDNDLLGSAFTEVLAKAEPINNDIRTLMFYCMQNAQVREVKNADGSISRVPVQVGKDGKVRLNDQGQPMTPEDLVVELKTKTVPHLFAPNDGGGNSNTNQFSGTPAPANLTEAQKIAIERNQRFGR